MVWFFTDGLFSFDFEPTISLQAGLVVCLETSSVCSVSQAGGSWLFVLSVLDRRAALKASSVAGGEGSTRQRLLQQACFLEKLKISSLQRLRHWENAFFSGLFAQGLKGISGLWLRGNLAFEQILVHRFSVNI